MGRKRQFKEGGGSPRGVREFGSDKSMHFGPAFYMVMNGRSILKVVKLGAHCITTRFYLALVCVR